MPAAPHRTDGTTERLGPEDWTRAALAAIAEKPKGRRSKPYIDHVVEWLLGE